MCKCPIAVSAYVYTIWNKVNKKWHLKCTYTFLIKIFQLRHIENGIKICKSGVCVDFRSSVWHWFLTITWSTGNLDPQEEKSCRVGFPEATVFNLTYDWLFYQFLWHLLKIIMEVLFFSYLNLNNQCFSKAFVSGMN